MHLILSFLLIILTAGSSAGLPFIHVEQLSYMNRGIKKVRLIIAVCSVIFLVG